MKNFLNAILFLRGHLIFFYDDIHDNLHVLVCIFFINILLNLKKMYILFLSKGKSFGIPRCIFVNTSSILTLFCCKFSNFITNNYF